MSVLVKISKNGEVNVIADSPVNVYVDQEDKPLEWHSLVDYPSPEDIDEIREARERWLSEKIR